MTPRATRFVMTSESAVSRPIMPKGASSNSAFFSKSLCGAWFGDDGVHRAVLHAFHQRGGVLGRGAAAGSP